MKTESVTTGVDGTVYCTVYSAFVDIYLTQKPDSYMLRPRQARLFAEFQTVLGTVYRNLPDISVLNHLAQRNQCFRKIISIN